MHHRIGAEGFEVDLIDETINRVFTRLKLQSVSVLARDELIEILVKLIRKLEQQDASSTLTKI